MMGGRCETGSRVCTGSEAVQKVNINDSVYLAGNETTLDETHEMQIARFFLCHAFADFA